jgi:hypothetical protein
VDHGSSQQWSTFVRNHLGQTWAADWFTIVTLPFQVLYGFVILDLGRREVVRLGVTPTPSAQYAAQSFVEAVCDRDERAPRFLIHAPATSRSSSARTYSGRAGHHPPDPASIGEVPGVAAVDGHSRSVRDSCG